MHYYGQISTFLEIVRKELIPLQFADIVVFGRLFLSVHPLMASVVKKSKNDLNSLQPLSTFTTRAIVRSGGLTFTVLPELAEPKTLFTSIGSKSM